MSIDLHMIGFTIVVSLIHDSSVIDIFAFSDPNIFNTYRGWVRSFQNSTNIIIEFILHLRVLLAPEIELIINDNPKSIRMCCSRNEWFNCIDELWITVWDNTNEYLPIVWDWKWLWRLVHNLSEIECDGIVIPHLRRHYLMVHFFALKQDSST